MKGTGNQQDYGFRIYDPRVGRFLSVDPLTRNFAWNSPYAYAENSPIKFIDLDGLEKFDPSFKPTGVTHIQRSTVPIHPREATTGYSIKAGNYQLYPVSDPSGKKHSYWLARYTFTEGPYKGMHRDDWIVGTDGVAGFVTNSDKYYNRASWIDYNGGANQEFSAGSIWKGYKEIVSDPMNWITGGTIWAAGLKGTGRNLLRTEVETASESTMLFGREVTTTTTRMGRDGKAVEIMFKDGSKIDISAARVKEWAPNTHPDAPSGTLQKVKFENSLPGSKGYKRTPTQSELEVLNGL